MSLKQCPECKREVSSDAPSCPGCGKPLQSAEPAKTSSGCGPIVFIGIVAILGFIVLSAIPGGHSDNDMPAQSPALPLNLIASVSMSDLHIQNMDDFAWSECTISIGRTDLGINYLFHRKIIAAGDERIIPLSGFVNPGGERFNGFAYRPKYVLVNCKTPKGNGTAGAQFN